MSAAAKPVSPPDSSTPERILGDDGGRAYRRFLAWTVGDGFALAVIEVRKPAYRRDLLAWTIAEIPGARVIALDQASGKPLRPQLELGCPSPSSTDVLVLTRLEDAADRIKLCARINIQRDELTRAFPLPWVVLVHPAAALEMQQHAPDFSDFAGLWLNEERDESATLTEAFETRGLSSMSLAAPAMHLSAESGASDLLGRAYVAIMLSNYDEAIDLLAQHDMHHPEAREHDPERMRLDGLLFWRHGQPAEALSRLEEARTRCEPADALLHMRLLGDIARIRAEQGDVDFALEVHEAALKVHEERGDRSERAGTLSDIARLLATKGEIDAALALHKEVLEIAEKVGDQRARAVSLSDIAHLLADQGKVDAALDLHKEALEINEELGDRRARAITLNDIAHLRAATGEGDVALALHREALKIYEELGDADGVANARWSLGRIAFQRGDYNVALDHLSTAYTLCNRLGRLDAICIVGLDLARLFLANSHKSEAIPILIRSRDGFSRLHRPLDAERAQRLIDTATDDV